MKRRKKMYEAHKKLRREMEQKRRAIENCSQRFYSYLNIQINQNDVSILSLRYTHLVVLI